MKYMGMIIAVCALILTSLAVAAPKSSAATTWYVDNNTGSDSHTGSSSSPFQTINHALAVCATGDTIDVDGGETYMLCGAGDNWNGVGLQVLTSGITLQTNPQSSSNAVLDAYNLYSGDGDGIDIGAPGNGNSINNVTINNLTVTNSAPLVNGNPTNGNGITIYNGSNDTVENCTVYNVSWVGITIGGTENYYMSGDLITGCTVHDCNQVNVNGRDESTGAWGASILVSSCYSSKVQYCNVYHNWGEGIGMYSMDASEETGDRGRNIVQNNTVGDDYSGNIYIADSENDDVWNNFVYDDGNTLLRNGYPNLGIAVCDENPNMLVYGCTICNNIVVGGINCFRYANSQLFGGFYNGGMNNFQIYNNVFYGSVQATVYINSDNGNNFTWENNITWQPTQNVACGADNQGTSPNGGYGTQVISNNCWVYSGGTSNMGGSGDLDYSYNTNPGFTESGGNIYSANFWTLASGYSVNTAGTNKTSTGWFTFDRNWASRPSSGAWSMGAYVGSGTSKTSTTTTLTSSLNPSTSGASVTFTATVSPSVPNGETVTFYNGGASIGTGTTSSSHATLTTSALPVGSDSITAAYAGDSSYNASTSGVLTQVVNGSGFSGYYRLKCRGSQLSLSTNNSNSAGTVLIQDTDEPGWYDQEFTITATGDGYYYLTCRGSQLNLSTNNSNSAGTAVIQDTKESGWWDQEFLMTPTGDGYYYVTCRGSQLNFSTNNSNSAGTTVIQDTQETGWWDQEFQLIAD